MQTSPQKKTLEHPSDGIKIYKRKTPIKMANPETPDKVEEKDDVGSDPVGELTKEFNLSEADLQQLSWLEITQEMSKRKNFTPAFKTEEVVKQACSTYGTVKRVLLKPKQRNSCFVQMGDITEAAKVRQGLGGTISRSGIRTTVRFFASPSLTDKLKITSGYSPKSLSRCLNYQSLTKEMLQIGITEQQLQSDKELLPAYKHFVGEIFSQYELDRIEQHPPDHQVRNQPGGAAPSDYLYKAVFFLPDLSPKFNFSGRFIGKEGNKVNHIRRVCNKGEVADPYIHLSDIKKPSIFVIQTTIMSNDSDIFLKSMKMVQNQWVGIFKEYFEENPQDLQIIFVKPFLTEKCRELLELHFQMVSKNERILCNYLYQKYH